MRTSNAAGASAAASPLLLGSEVLPGNCSTLSPDASLPLHRLTLFWDFVDVTCGCKHSWLHTLKPTRKTTVVPPPGRNAALEHQMAAEVRRMCSHGLEGCQDQLSVSGSAAACCRCRLCNGPRDVPVAKP